MSALTAKTPVPFRVPFVRGEAVTYVDPMDSSNRTPMTVKRAVNVQGMTKRIRYYVLDGAPGVLVPADRLLHSWEG